MNYKMIARIISFILLIEAALMVPSLFISLILKETASFRGFMFTILLLVVVGVITNFVTKNGHRNHFFAREGFATTGIAWIVMSAFGALPFVLSGEIPSYVDAFFETTSGFTTTGSSILSNVEIMSRGLLFWRSFTHWIGGMGVLVFLLSIVSLGEKNQGFSMHIMRAESPGPSVGKMKPRIKETAKILYTIYILLTALDIVFLIIGGMSVFEAFCIAFGTAGTGGFGVRNDSLASYSPYIQWVTTIFMFLFSINFTLYYYMFLRKFKDVFKNEELRLFLVVVVVATVLITINTLSYFPTIGERIRHVMFTVATCMSTTGYATVDFNLWPSFAKALLFYLMIIGACAGSTGGGAKQVRVLIWAKSLRRNLHKSLHPTEVQTIHLDGRTVDEAIVSSTSSFLIAYVGLAILSFFIISLDNFSFETNVSAVIATMSNIGPGFDQVGATCNYANYSVLSKLVLCINMLAGRLEIYPIIILFARSAWRKAR